MKTLLCADFEFYDSIYSKIPERNPDVQMDYVIDGKQALQKLSEKKYDFLITTIVMPEIHGLDLIDAIQADKDKYGNPKIAVLTGLGGEIFMEHIKKRKVDYIDRYDILIEDIQIEIERF
jgi:CheY-like chemotaxis protein